jgi:uncharacterized RDD family membrane protein YckC
MASASYLNGLPDPYASSEFYSGVLSKRFFAWVADTVLIGIVSVLILPFTAFAGIFFFPALMLIVGFFYRWFTMAGGSATWGMRLMAMEIRQSDGGHLTNETAFLHTLGYTISVAVPPLQLLSVVMMLLSDRRQGLSDAILGTAAINRPA